MTRHEKFDAETDEARRAALRAKHGLFDTDTPEFREMARRECETINNSPHHAEDMAWVEAMQTETWRELPPYDPPPPGDPDDK